MVDALLSEAKLIIEQGIDARLAAADKNAAEIARKDANDLINSQGDINNFLERKNQLWRYLQILILKIKPLIYSHG